MSESHRTADQSAVEHFLADPATHGGEKVQRIDTHAAVVFLAGERAYKIKRAVRFPYMDFSTLDKRHWALERELTLNRRTAPDLYLDLVPITRERDGLAMDGGGAVEEWLLIMRRFDQEALFDHLASSGRLIPALASELGRVVARFHEAAEVIEGVSGAQSLAAVIAENQEELAESPALFEPEAVARLGRLSEAALEDCRALLDWRAQAGFLRHCHGDLHLHNIVLWDGVPTLFDALEFDDDLARIDVLYDLAFLLMDLEHRELRPAANRVINRYLVERADYKGLQALALFLSVRAAIRAKVSVSVAEAQAEAEQAAAYRADATAYFRAALGYLEPSAPSLIAIGGLSGSGKSSLAYALAPRIGSPPGAVVLRSDELRKRLFGVAIEEKLPAEAYGEAAHERVYGALYASAKRVLAAGRSVILDAVHNRTEGRARAEALAREAGVAFTGLWLDAPEAALKDRVGSRGKDASDATASVVDKQLAEDPGEMSWRRIDAGRGLDRVVADAVRALDGSAD